MKNILFNSNSFIDNDLYKLPFNNKIPQINRLCFQYDGQDMDLFDYQI